MPCIYNRKVADRHCEYCSAVCDERPPKPYGEVITRNNLNKSQKGE